MDSNPRSPVDGELGAPGPRATRAARHRETPERRSFASTSSASDLRHTWGAFHMDKAGLEIEIGFGDFEHLGASLFAFSATFEICRGDRFVGMAAAKSGRQRDSLITAKSSLMVRFNSL